MPSLPLALSRPALSSPVQHDHATQALLNRFKAVAPVNSLPASWARQLPGREWAHLLPPRPLTDADLVGALTGQYWIGTRAPADGVVDRVAIDIDCKCPEPSLVAERTTRYHAVRAALGRQHVPLVYRTPTGEGLRVVYRIPQVRLTDVIDGHAGGPLADVLRAAGLEVTSGRLELFPQRTRVDRLMLGRRMALLDPSSLEPLPGCEIGEVFDPAVTERCLTEVERWHAAPLGGLLEDLRRARRTSGPSPAVRRVPNGAARRGARVASCESRTDANPPVFERTAAGVVPSPHVLDLAQHGLRRPSSRHESEWLMALDVLLRPAAYGLTREATSEAVAEAVAEWLAAHHNGWSREWSRSRRRYNSDTDAVTYWTRRYLTPTAGTGLDMIDRARRALSILDPLRARVLAPSDAERRQVLAIAERAFDSGAQRYRAEVWMLAWYRCLKLVYRYHAQRGNAPEVVVQGGRRTIVVELAASWMQGWAYGKGAAGEGAASTRYVRYAALLHDAGLLERVGDYRAPGFGARSPNGGRDLPGQARTYRVPAPDVGLTARDVVAPPWALRDALREVRSTRYGHPWSVDEALHALEIVRSARGEMLERYGRRTGDHVTRFAGEVRPLVDRASQSRLAPRVFRLREVQLNQANVLAEAERLVA